MNTDRTAILLIDTGNTIKQLLEDWEQTHPDTAFLVHHVENLQQALKQLANTDFNIVLLSIEHANEILGLRELQRQYRHLPIIVLYSIEDQELAIQAMQEGAQDFLAQHQLTSSTLVRAIRYAIERKRIAQHQYFIAEASNIFVSSHDPNHSFRQLCQILVPDLADWCIVYRVEHSHMLHFLAFKHIDPKVQTIIDNYADSRPFSSKEGFFIRTTIESNTIQVHNHVTPKFIKEAISSDYIQEMLLRFGTSSVLCTPLIVNQEVVAVVLLAHSQENRQFTTLDIDLVREISHRAAIALDNIRLYKIAQQEVEERTRIAQDLTESEERLAAIVNSAMYGIISFDQNYKIHLFNPAAEKAFLRNAHGESLLDLIPNYLERLEATTKQSEQTQLQLPAMIQHMEGIRSNGEIFPIEAILSQSNTQGEQFHTLMMRDMSLRYKHESQLRYQAEILENVSDAIITTDLGLKIIGWNKAAQELYGWSKEEILGKSILDFQITYHHSTPEQVISALWEKGSWNGILYHDNKEGNRLIVQTSISVIHSATGPYSNIIYINRDITEQFRAEQILHESQKRFLLIFNSSPAMITITRRRDDIITDVNDSVYRLLGYQPDEVIGRTAIELQFYVNTDDRQHMLHTRHHNGRLVNYENQFRTKSGELRIFSTYIEMIKLDDEEHYLAFNVDITEQKRLESQFLQAQKMESIGRLAGGVAHDFNNLLTAINGYAELAIQSLPEENPVVEDIQEIIQVSEQASKLTSQLLAFARKHKIEPQVIQLNSIIEMIDRLLHRLLGSNILLKIDLDQNLVYIKADPGQIEQIIVNMAVNARDAMPNGGSLTISTRNTTIRSYELGSDHEVPPGRYAEIIISDTGTGMPQQVVEKIFEPFFTTKSPDKGSGLGLATSYGIIKQHNGHITVNSIEGKGTTFHIFLPETIERHSSHDEAQQPVELLHGTETILLAEDDDNIRNLSTRVLREYGYTVYTASDGVQALQLAKKHQNNTIDLLILDMVMPHISGHALLEEIQTIQPNSKILLISGYTHEALAYQDYANLDLVAGFLQKPFSPSQLINTIRKVLDANKQ